MKWEISGKLSSDTKISPKWRIPLTIGLGVTIMAAGWMVKARMDAPLREETKQAVERSRIAKDEASLLGLTNDSLKGEIQRLATMIQRPETVFVRSPGRMIRDTLTFRDTLVLAEAETVTVVQTVQDTVFQVVRGKPSKLPWVLTGLALGVAAWRELADKDRPERRDYDE